MNLMAVFLVLISSVFSSIGSVLLKKGSKSFNFNLIKQIKNTTMILGLFLFVASSVIYIIALKMGELSVLYPVAAAQYVWVSLLSKKYLKEQINHIKWIGIVLIIFGIIIINL